MLKTHTWPHLKLILTISHSSFGTVSPFPIYTDKIYVVETRPCTIYPDSKSTTALFLSQSNNICLKQAWYKQSEAGSAHIFSGATQGKHLAVELNCLRWGSCLLKEVYDFMSSNGKELLTFEVPQLRFVGAALAVAQNDLHDTFLVEELIDNDGPFVKYINNNSAQPRNLADPNRARIARFLCFSQHVQWIQTKGLVYISDFQGLFNRMLVLWGSLMQSV